MRIQSKNNKQKYIAIGTALAVSVALAAVAMVYYFTRADDAIKRDANGVSVERTAQDKALEEKLEKDPSGKTEPSQTDRPMEPEIDSSTQLQQANVVLTSASERDGSVSASGFVSNVTEEGGGCTYLFKKSGTVIEKKSQTLANANSTTCTTIRFDKSELLAGVWTVSVEYASTTSSGKSNEMEMTVR